MYSLFQLLHEGAKEKNSRVFKTEEDKMGAQKVNKHFKTCLCGYQLHRDMGPDSTHDYRLKSFCQLTSVSRIWKFLGQH